MNVDLTLVFLGLIVFSAHVFASLYNRKKIPDVLLLIIIGLILGPLFGWVSPSSLGMSGPVFVAVTLVVILFEGGTSLSFNVLQSAWKSTMNLTVSCFFLSMGLVALVSWLFGLAPLSALTLGSILGGTSSAVVIPLMRMLDVSEESRTVLVLESAATDVLCIVFTLAFMDAMKIGHLQVGNVVGNILSSFILAGLLGFAGALVWSRIITSIRKLQNSIFTTPAFVFVIYGVTNFLGWSGAIAAMVFGITMANIDTIKNRVLLRIMGGQGHKLNKTEMVFFGELVFLLKTLFFVYIGISIEFSDWKTLLVGLIITFVLFFGRILVARFFSPKTATPFDKTVIAMMIPKGLAAAVLASMPLELGLAGGEFIKNVTYATILFSIMWVSLMILLVDKSRTVRHIFGKLLGGGDSENSNIFVNDVERNASEEDDGMDDRTPFSFISKMEARLEKMKKKEETEN
ncbi:MAG: cation:proton antiporter [Bacteroidales bacterium]|nr:cation:proton antiporter [Bacteroidales bacterium]